MIKQPVYEDNYENHIAFLVRNIDGDLKNKEIERLNILYKSKHQGFTCSESQRLAKLYLEANFKPKIPKPLTGLAKIIDEKLLKPQPEIVTKYVKFQPLLNLLIENNKQNITSEQIIVINMADSTYAVNKTSYLKSIYNFEKIVGLIQNIIVQEKYLVAYFNPLDAKINEVWLPLRRDMRIDYRNDAIFDAYSIKEPKEQDDPVRVLVQEFLGAKTKEEQDALLPKFDDLLGNVKDKKQLTELKNQFKGILKNAPENFVIGINQRLQNVEDTIDNYDKNMKDQVKENDLQSVQPLVDSYIKAFKDAGYSKYNQGHIKYIKTRVDASKKYGVFKSSAEGILAGKFVDILIDDYVKYPNVKTIYNKILGIYSSESLNPKDASDIIEKIQKFFSLNKVPKKFQ